MPDAEGDRRPVNTNRPVNTHRHRNTDRPITGHDDGGQFERALRRTSEQVQAGLACQEEAWSRGFTRRRMLQGVGMAGVAALASQLVTTKVAYAAGPGTSRNTVVVVFLRGGADGLRMLVPQAARGSTRCCRSTRPANSPSCRRSRPPG